MVREMGEGKGTRDTDITGITAEDKVVATRESTPSSNERLADWKHMKQDEGLCRYGSGSGIILTRDETLMDRSDNNMSFLV